MLMDNDYKGASLLKGSAFFYFALLLLEVSL